MSRNRAFFELFSPDALPLMPALVAHQLILAITRDAITNRHGCAPGNKWQHLRVAGTHPLARKVP